LKKDIKLYKHFTVMVDDSVNNSNSNEMCVYVRYLNERGEAKNAFLKLVELGTGGSKSDILYAEIKKVLIEWGLDIKLMVGFSSDGASNMRGVLTSVAAQIRRDYPWVVTIHCCAHRQHLAASDALKDPLLSPLLELIKQLRGVVNFINRSALRESVFKQIQKNETNVDDSYLSLLAPPGTRWLALFECIKSILRRYKAVLLFLSKDASSGRRGRSWEAREGKGSVEKEVEEDGDDEIPELEEDEEEKKKRKTDKEKEREWLDMLTNPEVYGKICSLYVVYGIQSIACKRMQASILYTSGVPEILADMEDDLLKAIKENRVEKTMEEFIDSNKMKSEMQISNSVKKKTKIYFSEFARKTVAAVRSRFPTVDDKDESVETVSMFNKILKPDNIIQSFNAKKRRQRIPM
jgi:metal-sulfur cluster biosynthetic enzyme